MFLTQLYGTVLGGFVNYAIMISIVSSNRALLTDGNGNSSWSGAGIQSYNTNAASWALAPYIYKIGTPYGAIPIGLAVGAGAVVVHRIFYHVSNPIAFPIALGTDIRLTLSLYPKSESSTLRKSISRSTSNTPVIFPTTKARPASSSPGSPPDSTFNIISATISRGFSRIIHISLPAPLMVLV